MTSTTSGEELIRPSNPAAQAQAEAYAAMLGFKPAEPAKPKGKKTRGKKKPEPSGSKEPEREPIDITQPLGRVEAQLLFLDRVFSKDLGGGLLPRWVPEPTGHEPQALDGKPPQTESDQEARL